MQVKWKYTGKAEQLHSTLQMKYHYTKEISYPPPLSILLQLYLSFTDLNADALPLIRKQPSWQQHLLICVDQHKTKAYIKCQSVHPLTQRHAGIIPTFTGNTYCSHSQKLFLSLSLHLRSQTHTHLFFLFGLTLTDTCLGVSGWPASCAWVCLCLWTEQSVTSVTFTSSYSTSVAKNCYSMAVLRK